MKRPFFFDMETADPDDVFALSLLATHPQVDLVGVTVHPGGRDQVGIVRHILNRLDKFSVPIGTGTPKSYKPRVSRFHYDWLGQIPPCDSEWKAHELIWSLTSGQDLHLVTGAALTNVLDSYRYVWFKKWTCQGGFAGDNIVPPEHRLEKFNGKVTCPTFNLNGDVKAAKRLLCEDLPGVERWMVSKNVCHGVIWDQAFNERVPSGAHAGLDLIREGMSRYFKKNPGGKALHDVIAVAAAIDPSIGTWARVTPYRASNGEWGCHESTDPASPLILTALDLDRFIEVLAGD